MKKHAWSEEFARKAAAPHGGRDYVVKPALFKLAGSVKGKDVLELGAGTGYWLRAFAAKGARCVGVDLSENQLAIARARSAGTPIVYIHGDITKVKLGQFKKKFDIILLEHVLLEVSSIKDIESIFKRSSKLLKKTGHILVSDVHPIAPSIKEGKNIKVGKNYSYFSSGELFEGISTTADGKKVHYHDRHWTLEDLCSGLTKAGFVIEEIREPRPSAETARKHPSVAYRLTKPMSLIIKARLQ